MKKWLGVFFVLIVMVGCQDAEGNSESKEEEKETTETVEQGNVEDNERGEDEESVDEEKEKVIQAEWGEEYVVEVIDVVKPEEAYTVVLSNPRWEDSLEFEEANSLWNFEVGQSTDVIDSLKEADFLVYDIKIENVSGGEWDENWIFSQYNNDFYTENGVKIEQVDNVFSEIKGNDFRHLTLRDGGSVEGTNITAIKEEDGQPEQFIVDGGVKEFVYEVPKKE